MSREIQPRVSVIMGIYNCASTLVASVDSIARQTYANWEMILCDDGSTDNTLRLAQDWARHNLRTRVLANGRNLGLARSLDRCIAEARGELLARQDGDDLSEPDRLAKLVDAMDAHPDVAVVSSWMTCFDQNGVWGMVRTKPFPVANDFLSGSPICHAPCLMRRAPVLAVGGYGTQRWVLQVEDLYLWFRLYAAGHRAMNIPEALYRVRDDENARRRRTLRRSINHARVQWKGFGMLGFPWHKRLWAVRPLLVWALPGGVYRHLHRNRLKRPMAPAVASS